MRHKKIEKIREKLTNDFYQGRRKIEQHSIFLTWVAARLFENEFDKNDDRGTKCHRFEAFNQINSASSIEVYH